MNTVPVVKHSFRSLMLWGYFVADGSDSLVKVNNIIRKEDYYGL